VRYAYSVLMLFMLLVSMANVERSLSKLSIINKLHKKSDRPNQAKRYCYFGYRTQAIKMNTKELTSGLANTRARKKNV
jgi:hypothetical protein